MIPVNLSSKIEKLTNLLSKSLNKKCICNYFLDNWTKIFILDTNDSMKSIQTILGKKMLFFNNSYHLTRDQEIPNTAFDIYIFQDTKNIRNIVTKINSNNSKSKIFITNQHKSHSTKYLKSIGISGIIDARTMNIEPLVSQTENLFEKADSLDSKSKTLLKICST